MAEELRRLRIKRTEQLEREGRKPIGFYKKGGKTRPITKAKPKKTRVVKKTVTKKPKKTKKPKVVKKQSIAQPAATIQPPTGIASVPYGGRLGAHGYEFDFPSSSSSRTYTTIFYTEDHGRFKAGDISCNCPGWTRRTQPDGSRSCKHTKEVDRMGLQGPSHAPAPSPPQASVRTVNRIVSAGATTQSKFDKAVKGAQTTGLAGFHMDNSNVIALLVDVTEAIHGASQDIAHFIQGDLGANRAKMRAPDASYKQITKASLGKSIKNAADPKDGEELFIGDTTYRKDVVKVALRTLGGARGASLLVRVINQSLHQQSSGNIGKSLRNLR